MGGGIFIAGHSSKYGSAAVCQIKSELLHVRHVQIS